MSTFTLLPSGGALSGSLVSWVAPDGTVYNLDDRVNRFVTSIRGHELAPIEIARSAVPYVPGTRVRLVRSREREIHIVVHLNTESFVLLRDEKEVLYRAFWSGDAEGDRVRFGWLRFTLVAGTTRQTRALYLLGAEGDTTQGIGGWEDVVLTFLCPDAHYEALEDTVVDLVAGTSSVSWFGRPWFPFELSASSVLAGATIDNTGDIDAWPIWTLTGPMSNPILRNVTTGAVLSIPTTVQVDSTLTVATRPGYHSVVFNGGVSAFGVVTGNSVLWGLRPGLNVIRVEASGTASMTDAVLNYRLRYLSP